MTDEEALDLAWEMLIAKEPDHLDLRSGSENDKEFAAYRLQCKNLNLKPWQNPPCHLDEDKRPDEKDEQAYKILKRMIKANISPWHPDPLTALQETKR